MQIMSYVPSFNCSSVWCFASKNISCHGDGFGRRSIVFVSEELCFCGATNNTKDEFLCNLTVTGAQAASTVPAATTGAPTV
jgi:hypothetical protein